MIERHVGLRALVVNVISWCSLYGLFIRRFVNYVSSFFII